MTALKPSHFLRADRVAQMAPSSTLGALQAAEQLRASGAEVFDLGAGEPDFPTPEHIKAAAVRALQENFTKYTPAAGTNELKRAILDRLAADYGIEYSPEEVAATAGGKQAIFNAMLALLNPGDEVLLPSPYWVTFPEIIEFAGARSVVIDTEPNQFVLTREMVSAHLTPKSKLLIIVSPSNPTGRIIPAAEFTDILDLAASRGIYVISDECYREFTYPPAEPVCAAQLGGHIRDRLLVAGSMSKTYAMTGWRLGYALGPAPWISEIVKIQSHSTSNPSSISQKAAIAGLRGSSKCLGLMLEEYLRRRDFVVPALNSIPGFECSVPEGAFYAFPNINEFLKRARLSGSKEVEHRLMKEAHVVLTAGVSFGAEGYLRISYANAFDAIERGVKKIQEFVEKAV